MTSIPAPPWRAVFVDAMPALGDELQRRRLPHDIEIAINRDPDVASAALPALLDGVPIALVDHTALPTTVARATLPNVTLSAHSAFRTAEANARLIGAALAHCRRIATG